MRKQTINLLGSSIIIMLMTLALFHPKNVYASEQECLLGTTMNIVAHQNDDILFINPDIQNDILAGRCVITVYLTAGDADRGEAYWATRENGPKAAYALMSMSPNFWVQKDAGIINHPIPVFTLSGQEKVSLAFLRLPDGNYDGLGFASNNYQSLQKLWEGNISSIMTVDSTSTYTKDSLINTLTQLMEKYKPDIVRTQNFMDQYNSSVDHSDHYSTSYLTNSASQAYGTSHLLVGYYDYEINNYPQNLFNSDVTNKKNIFISYAQFDPLVCQNETSCDQNLKYSGWFKREYIVATVTPNPSPIPTPTSTGLPTPTPSTIPTVNIAPQGTGYRWSQMTSATANTNQILSTGVNDNNLTIDVPLNGGPDDNRNAYEAAGVIWSDSQSGITKIKYINGTWDSALNGAFTTNFQLQSTVDGISWFDTGAVSNPTYNYDSSASSGKTYVFNINLPDNTRGIRVVGQVRTSSSLSWHANTRELIIETESTSINPSPTATGSPTSIPTQAPTASPLINIAPQGTGYRWSQMTSIVATTNQIQSNGMNDSNLINDIPLNGGPDDNKNAYEAAGIIWNTAQNNITRFQFINGSWDPAMNGAFTSNLQLQTSIDGVTWTDSGLSSNPSYTYDSPNTSNKTYVFSGFLANNIRGIRIVGQVRTPLSLSWHANIREIIVESESPVAISTPTPTNNPTNSPTPVPTFSPSPNPSFSPLPTPAPTATPTTSPSTTPIPSGSPTPTPTPSGSLDLLSNNTWTLSGSNGSAENNKEIGTNILSGKTSVSVKFDVHGSKFGTGDDEASIIFIQSGTWYAANLMLYGTNEMNGTQTVIIPLTAFHKVGGSTLINLANSVSDLHVRFWNRNTFTVDLLSVIVQ